MRAIASYKRTAIESAPNEELVVLLCEAAVMRADRADAAMERNDRGAWLGEIHVARAIYLELLQALDPTAAPNAINAMRDTYRWLLHHLTEAGRTGDRERMGEVRRVATTVHDTWSRAVSIHREGAESTPLAEDISDEPVGWAS
jgi:flagellar biosynthetic protein FliS